MSYTSGVGSPQQGINSISQSEAKPTIQPGAPAGLPSDGLIASVGHADQTSLSSASGLVAQALDSPDVRSAKVAALQQAIAAGSYSVSSSDVADKIIQSLLR
jgi:negative regulator of flagellin synthesis FlgM